MTVTPIICDLLNYSNTKVKHNITHNDHMTVTPIICDLLNYSNTKVKHNITHWISQGKLVVRLRSVAH